MSWALYDCARVGIEFSLQHDQYPIGVACFQGWEDYFQPFCAKVAVPRFGNCNRMFYSRLLGGWQRRISRQLLDFHTRSKNYYMFDRALISRLLGSRASDGVQDRDTLFNSVYRYNLVTSAAVSARLSTLPKVNSDWVSLHIRRGDKISEASYVDLQYYVNTLSHIQGWRDRPLFVMSDSASVITEFAGMIRRPVYQLSGYEGSYAYPYGYDQEGFNLKPAWGRYTTIVDFLAELEVARNSGDFIGSSTSNIFHIIRLLKSNPLLRLWNVARD